MNDTPVFAYIERLTQVNARYQYLDLAVDDESIKQIRPGQSLLVRLEDRDPLKEQWDPYLREHWWPVGLTEQGMLRVERPRDQDYQLRQFLSLIGPVGKPYRFRRSLRNVLLIAYNTEPTPLTIMAPLLKRNGVSTTMVLLGIAREYDTAHLPEEIEVIHGDERLSWEEQVMTLGWADQVFVVVGHGDEPQRFTEVVEMIQEKRFDIPKNYLFGVFQPVMPCGTGACFACMVRTKDGPVPACQEGPAFDLTQVILPGPV